MKRVGRAFALMLASTFYVGLLFLTAAFIALRFTVAEPTTIKGWLKESGAYEAVVPEVTKLATIQQANESSVVQITSDDTLDSATSAFTSDGIQRDAETVIDGFYGWFRGNTSGPEFRVDLTARKNLFAKYLAETVAQKIADLPECSGGTTSFTLQAFDPFTADCRPKGLDIANEAGVLEEELASTDDLLPQTVLTGGDIKVNTVDGQSERVGSAYPWVQRVYSALLWVPWVLLGVTVLTALVLFFLSSSRRKGTRRVASGLIFTGVTLLASGFLLGPLLKMTDRVNGLFGASQSIMENIINPLVEQINGTYARISILTGAVYTILAVLMYSALLITRRSDDAPEHPQVDENVTASADEASVQDNDVPLAAPAPQPAPTSQQDIHTSPTLEQAVPREVLGVPPVTESVPAQQTAVQTPASARREVTRRPPLVQG
jgi:hypothetical protein